MGSLKLWTCDSLRVDAAHHVPDRAVLAGRVESLEAQQEGIAVLRGQLDLVGGEELHRLGEEFGTLLLLDEVHGVGRIEIARQRHLRAAATPKEIDQLVDPLRSHGVHDRAPGRRSDPTGSGRDPRNGSGTVGTSRPSMCTQSPPGHSPSGWTRPRTPYGSPRQRYTIANPAAPAHATFGVDRKDSVQFAVVVAVFPIIFLGELPDKTMFASLVLSTTWPPGVVWLGAAAAFVVHVVIAVTVGVALFHLLPPRALDAFVAAMFLAGALLALREARKERREEKLVEREVASHRRIAITAFAVIFIAEWGDLTQILTANLAAHYHDPLSVGVGAVLALWTVAGLAVVSGQSILRLVNVATVRIVTAVVLAGLTGWAVYEAVR